LFSSSSLPAELSSLLNLFLQSIFFRLNDKIQAQSARELHKPHISGKQNEENAEETLNLMPTDKIKCPHISIESLTLNKLPTTNH